MKTLKKTFALCLALVLILGLTACDSDGIPFVGGMLIGNSKEVQTYLEEICPFRTPLLTEHIEAKEKVENAYSIQSHTSYKTLINYTEKDTVERQLAELPVRPEDSSKIYPGAILFASQKLLHGNPDALESEDLPRRSYDIALGIGEELVDDVTVNSPSSETAHAAIKDLASRQSGIEPSVSYTYTMAYNDGQVETLLGISDASAYFGLDYEAVMSGKIHQMLVTFDSNYYSIMTPTNFANRLFERSVDKELLQKNGVNEDNPALVEVAKVNYGKRYVVLMEAKITGSGTDIYDAWTSNIDEKGIGANYAKRDVTYSILRNTMYKVYEFTDTEYKLIKETDLYDEVNSILQSLTKADDLSALVPLSYTAEFVTDKAPAIGHLSADFYKVSVQSKHSTHVKISTPDKYSLKYNQFYGKPITGIADDGSYILGDWECVMESRTNNDCEFYVDSIYGEYGYSITTQWGTDWPYSDSFWNQSDGIADEVFIDIGGESRTVWIKIYVNGELKFEDTNCDSHKNYFK